MPLALRLSEGLGGTLALGNNPLELLLPEYSRPSVSECASERVFVRALQGNRKRRAASNDACTVYLEYVLCVRKTVDGERELPTKARAGFAGSCWRDVPPGSTSLGYLYLNLQLVPRTRRLCRSGPVSGQAIGGLCLRC
jgi:hypothetical protein